MSPPDKPPRPRAPSQSELQPAKVDQTVGAAKDYAASQDHVRPELARKGTLIGMGATRAPGPPPLPPELRPTAPAAALTAPTVRATPAAGIRIPENETPSGGQQGPSAELAKDMAELAEFRRRERIQIESRQPGPYQQPMRSPSPVPSSDSIRADGTVQSLRKAQTRLYLALAAFVALAAYPTVSWLQSAAEVKAQSQRADVKANAATTVADSAKATATDADKELTKLRDEFRLYRANMREVMRLQGIDMPRHPDDPDPNDLKPVTPYCPRGKVCTGPQLVLQVAP